jgi:hypothetical protein
MALANIVLADAQATPVNHTFVPLGLDRNNVLWFEDQSQASPIGFWRVSFELKRPEPGSAGQSSANRVYRVKIGLHEPALENVTNSTVSGVAPAPTISYVCRSNVEHIIAERSSVQNRKDLRKMTYNLQNEAQLVNLVENLIFPY